MEEIGAVLFSWQFLLIGVIVFLLMYVFMFLGTRLWALDRKWLRRVLVWTYAASPYLPGFLGAGLGAIPVWPRPGPLQELPDEQGYFAMILLGLVAGLLYERIWKGVKQYIESRGLDIELSVPPREQRRLR
jgi:hypothetical protein